MLGTQAQCGDLGESVRRGRRGEDDGADRWAGGAATEEGTRSAEGAAPTGGAGRSGTESARDAAERREVASETWHWRAGAAGC